MKNIRNIGMVVLVVISMTSGCASRTKGHRTTTISTGPEGSRTNVVDVVQKGGGRKILPPTAGVPSAPGYVTSQTSPVTQQYAPAVVAPQPRYLVGSEERAQYTGLYTTFNVYSDGSRIPFSHKARSPAGFHRWDKDCKNCSTVIEDEHSIYWNGRVRHEKGYPCPTTGFITR